MLRLMVSFFIILSEMVYCQAGESKATVVQEFWDAAYLQNHRAGYVHTITQEIEQANQKLLRTTVALRLTVKRNNDVIQLSMDTGTLETHEGKVVGVFMKQFLGKNKTLDLSGTVVGNELRLFLDSTKPLHPAPWDDRVVGLFQQQKLFKDKNIKPGDEFSYLSFEPSINLVVKTFAKVMDYEEIEVLGSKKRLLRVETRPEKIEKVQLPSLLSWLGDDFTVQRSQVEIPGLGLMVLYRTSKELATTPGNVASLTDVGLSHMVRLNRRIIQPYDVTAAVYHITIRNEEDPATTFSRDPRQEMKNVRGSSLELHVRASKGMEKPNGENKVGAEFTQSSYFINSADPLVQDYARKAVGLEKDSWKKALRIEKWVHDHMRTKNHEALATADHVARTLEGDCTEYAMLMAAMCRAEGIPSRTAVGLVYADVKGMPVFAFHMWTEVFVGGGWISLDATLGRGKVGATHLKITDQSWHETRTLAPLFPVVRVLGRLSIEVLRAETKP